MPFLVENKLKRLGDHYEKGADCGAFTIVEGI
jgi:hypothetical protein